MINDHTQATAAAGPRRWLSGWLPSSGYHRRSRSRYATGGNRKVLRDGSQVLIRQVRSTDAPLLAGLAGLVTNSAHAVEILVVMTVFLWLTAFIWHIVKPDPEP